jgi:hypothetical protein
MTDILTFELIDNSLNHDVMDQEENRVEVTPETISYLHQLLFPYMEAMVYAPDQKSLEDWVNQVFDGRTLDRIENSISNSKIKMRNLASTNDIKEAIISGLLDTIFYEADARGNSYDSIIHPWIIKGSMESENRHDIAKYFGIVINEDSPTVLPVTVTIGDNHYVHDMSFEFVLGIIAFYHFLNQPHPLSMFGSTFSTYLQFVRDKISHDTNQAGYTVTVGNISYDFYDIDFMRGLLTAALWTNIDPHAYITNLVENKYHFVKPTGEIVTGLPNIGDRGIRQKIPLNY